MISFVLNTATRLSKPHALQKGISKGLWQTKKNRPDSYGSSMYATSAKDVQISLRQNVVIAVAGWDGTPMANAIPKKLYAN